MAAVPGALLSAQSRSPESNSAIFEEVWRNVRDNFYDPGTRGVDWQLLKGQYLGRAQACGSADELLSVLREMLSRLRNSHIFLYSRQEWALRGNILPFYLDEFRGHANVRYVLRKDGRPLADLQPGDAVLSVDGIAAHEIRPLTLARLDPIRGNPNFGPAGSIARIEALRGGRRVLIDAPRVKRPGGFDAVALEQPGADVCHLRFQTLEESQLPFGKLRPLWASATERAGLVLDLRNCVGGDPRIYAFLASSLLGPGVPLFRWIPRSGSGEGLIPAQTDGDAARFAGRLALILNANTESGPELLAATLQEYSRGRVFGERSAGAFNGPTMAYGLPENFALFALPYARSVSPKGVEYEGRAVQPDVAVKRSAKSLAKGIDPALERAVQFASA